MLSATATVAPATAACGATADEESPDPAGSLPTLLRDDFDDPGAWQLDGAVVAIAPGVDGDGCELVMSPVCCGAYQDAVRPVDLEPAAPLYLAVDFRTSAGLGSADTVFEAVQPNGRSLVLTTTEGAATANHGVRLYYGDSTTGAIFADTRAFFYTGAPDAWLTARIHLDPATGLAYASVFAANGTLLAQSGKIEIREGDFSAISMLRFRAVAHAPDPSLFHWDTLVVSKAPRIPADRARESFDTLTKWTVVGGSSQVVCDDGAPGCFVRMEPACCHEFRDLSRPVDVHPGLSSTTSILFRASSTGGSADAVFQFLQPDGRTLVFTPTEGWNNGVRLFYGDDASGTILSDTGTFGTWNSTSTWYRATIHVDGEARTAFATLREANGTLLATSPTISTHDSTFEHVSELRFRAVSYGSDLAFDWDTLAMLPS